MDLYDAMSTLRAVRRIKPDPIPDEVLDRVLRASTWAPSGGNRQCWRMIVVRDPVLKNGAGETLQAALERVHQRLRSAPQKIIRR